MTDKKKETDARIQARVTPELMKQVEAKAIDGRVTCAALRDLAETLGVPYRVAGAAADSAGIRVQSCELGCF